MSTAKWRQSSSSIQLTCSCMKDILETMTATYGTKEKLELMEQRCRQMHVPVTAQRRLVFGELAARRDHPAADHIFESLQAKKSGLSRTTVYRTMETLRQMGLIKRVPTPLACARFDAETTHHHHFVCTVCERVFDVPASGDSLQDSPMQLPEGFLAAEIETTITGWCNQCRKQV